MNNRELFASRIHDVWAHWQDYLHSKLQKIELVSHEDGKVHTYYVLDEKLYKRWVKQIDTPYDKLSAEEKQSDRDIYDQFYADLVEKIRTETIEFYGKQ